MRIPILPVYACPVLTVVGFGYSTAYAHGARNLVRVGRRVKREDVIVSSGSTGLHDGTARALRGLERGQSDRSAITNEREVTDVR